MKFTYKMGSAIATVAVLGSLMAPAAFAQGTNTISHNGAHSINTINGGGGSTKNITKQKSNTTAYTSINAGSNAGNNTVIGNTGGTSGVNTGPATTSVVVGVNGGSNTGTVSPCNTCSPTGGTNSITGNGAGSINTINDSTGCNLNVVKQSNNVFASTSINAGSNTGGNSAIGNTGGGSSITTGASSTGVSVTVTGGDNTLNPVI